MNIKLGLIVMVICLTGLFFLQQQIDARNPPLTQNIEDVLYLPSGNAVKRLSFGFDGFLADIYWMRSVQYFGRQLLNERQELDWVRTSKIRYDLLYPLLDITTTLDPQYIAAYRFGAIFLPDYDNQLALKLIYKGIENNPQNWRLYQNLGMLYWQMKDYPSASNAFIKGSEQVGAPIWMKIIGGVLLSQGGDRSTACQLYTSFLAETEAAQDTMIKMQMEMQLQRVYALDEVDYLNRKIDQYRQLTGQCPASLAALIPLMRRDGDIKGACGQPVRIQFNNQGAAVSPLGMPYKFDTNECRAKMPFELYEPQ
ncbi:MAG: hypothetical protein AB1489_28845 [Acidobacteriota bacterium]